MVSGPSVLVSGAPLSGIGSVALDAPVRRNAPLPRRSKASPIRLEPQTRMGTSHKSPSQSRSCRGVSERLLIADVILNICSFIATLMPRGAPIAKARHWRESMNPRRKCQS
jgi:hypothetical protein